MRWDLLYCTVCLFLGDLYLLQCSDEQFDFVPDVVDNPPQSVLNVKFGEVELHVGAELTPTQVKAEPVLSWQAKSDEYYTVAMIDPDAPSREDPKFRSFLHWLVINIPGDDLSTGETVSAYVGSGPPKGTGLHRYVLLVFRQSGIISYEGPRASKTTRMGRKSFSIQKFAEKYGLELPALAGNYYRAEWDDYVPTVHKQLSGE